MRMRLNILLVLPLLIAITTAAFSQATKQDTLKELMRRIEILTEEIEKEKLGGVAQRKYEGQYGLGSAASQVYHKKDAGASIAGYGELVFQNYAGEKDNGSPAGKTNQIDFLRAILYVGYKFNERFLFNSEIELEHALAGDSKPGEVAVEFGYIDGKIIPELAVRTGMVLVPVGIINELHEPSTFYGSLRPETERFIIPTTWRAIGVGLVGSTVSGIGYRVYMVESLNAAKFSAGGIRSGRQNGAKALAEDFALSGRLEYIGFPGLNVGASFFSGKTGQGLRDTTGAPVNPVATILSAHGIFVRKGVELRVLVASTWISDATQLNSALGFTGNRSVGERQFGYYGTLAYNFLPLLKPDAQAALQAFVQYERYNTQQEVPPGFTSNPENERTNITFGLMYKPIANIGFKIDYINRDNKAGTALDQFNAAVTYLF